MSERFTQASTRTQSGDCVRRCERGQEWEDGTGQRIRLVEQTVTSPAWWRVEVTVPSIASPKPAGRAFQISEWAIVTYGQRVGEAVPGG